MPIRVFLLIPGFEALKFSPLLRAAKRRWGASAPRYATFWDPRPLLLSLREQGLSTGSLNAIRDRLILCFRLIALYRSVDLERLYRKVSVVSGEPYVWVRRKGWMSPRWEKVVSIPGEEELSPWHLLMRYVSLTKEWAQPGSQVLRSHVSPHAPLTADTIGKLTKKLLARAGVPSVWAPHTTRGGRRENVPTLGCLWGRCL